MPEQIINASGVQYGMVVNSDGSINVNNAVTGGSWDYISLSQTSTEDEWTFKTGGVGGTTISTVTVTYTSSAKETISTVVKA